MNVLFMAIMAGVIPFGAGGTLLIFAPVVTRLQPRIYRRIPLKVMCTASVLCSFHLGRVGVLSNVPAPPSFIIVTLSTLFWLLRVPSPP